MSSRQLTCTKVIKSEVRHICLLLLGVAAISGLPRGLLCLGLGICGCGCLALHWGKPAPAGLAQACCVLLSVAPQAVCMPAPLRMHLLALVLQHGSERVCCPAVYHTAAIVMPSWHNG